MRYVGPLQELLDQPRFPDPAPPTNRHSAAWPTHSPALADGRQQFLEDPELSTPPNKPAHQDHLTY
ncbi:hypothetical protein GCM10009745_21240 [Kribbella yunnanensis]|uniref:Uncharacterized protein n=1 Tax=Kribbella yunnanensis TaxID=190194 RepID=A0ABP4STX8_9ACTN